MKYAWLLGGCVMAMNLCGKQAQLMTPRVTSACDCYHLYGVVLAGGSGDRLWPLSSATQPKQLLAVGSEKTLLEQAVNRLTFLMPRESIKISTTQAFKDAIKKVIGGSSKSFLIEPCARNTGPSLVLSCLRIYEQDPEAIILFIPADAYIPESDTSLYVACLKKMVDHVARYDTITLCGIKPTYPATGYGYIAYGESDKDALPVLAFKEKPSLALAQQYVDSGMMLWNGGIFCASARVFLQECKHHAPQLYADILAVHKGKKTYESVESISIDFAVLEKSSAIAVVPATFSWCDVGNVAVFLSLQQANTSMSVVSIDAHNNLVSVPNKVVALVGVDDLCVIETADSLLICKQSEAEKVRKVVDSLKNKSMVKNV